MTDELSKNYHHIIQDYTLDNNLIYINYTDGTKEVRQISLYQIDMINSEMIRQAKTIVEDKTSEEYLSSRNVATLTSCTSAATIAILTSLATEISYGTFDPNRLLIEAAATVIATAATYFFIKKYHNNEDREIQKYKLFIEHSEDFNKYGAYSEVYEGIHKKGVFGINTIDKYTYPEVKHMAENLARVRERVKN